MGAHKLADDLAYPPRAMRADRAAAYLSMSTSTFLKLVDERRLPQPKRLGGLVFWDRLKLDAFVDGVEDDEVNELEQALGVHHARHDQR
jgi:predicted DNA-binding transcriptional regulator AlpA